MPTYEYACKACHHEWTVEQRITEAPVTECPNCHKAEAQRQISGGNFILKGGGWYADLYSSSSNKKSETTSKDASSSEAKSDAKTENKSETKSETKSEPAKTPTTPPKAT
jgi:putative FmdB family regulatory protein